MASLFTPESERIRSSASKATNTPVAKIPGMPTLKGHKSGDSLGNPNSPGYEPWGKKKKGQEAKAAEEHSPHAPTVIETTSQGPELIRLSLGWDAILLAQKKLCEKAKGLFTRLEGPEKYRSQRKARALSLKSRGCIVDVDIQQAADEKAAQQKAKESA